MLDGAAVNGPRYLLAPLIWTTTKATVTPALPNRVMRLGRRLVSVTTIAPLTHTAIGVALQVGFPIACNIHIMCCN